MLGTVDNSVLVVDENEVEDQLLQDRIGAPITKMAVAPNGRFLACYRRDGILTVMSATFTTKVRTISVNCFYYFLTLTQPHLFARINFFAYKFLIIIINK